MKRVKGVVRRIHPLLDRQITEEQKLYSEMGVRISYAAASEIVAKKGRDRK